MSCMRSVTDFGQISAVHNSNCCAYCIRLVKRRNTKEKVAINIKKKERFRVNMNLPKFERDLFKLKKREKSRKDKRKEQLKC
jgi:hypothetical protein